MFTIVLCIMSTINVEIGRGNSRSIDIHAIECPFCHARITPNYLFLHDGNLFAYCPNSDCNKHFVLQEYYAGLYTMVRPNSGPARKQFSETIQRVSAEFTEIFNQAYYAEQVTLNQICGAGYRKALEFLIKDYLLSNIREDDIETRERIKKKLLGNCIAEDVSNDKIKAVAQRAVWLGNDETHYVRKWTNKDVSHLKGLIELTVRWIESEVETQELIDDMPEPK